MPGLKSQSGQVFVLAGNEADDANFQGNLIHWRSQRIKRVCRSTFAAETLSAIDAVDQGIFIRDMLSGWLNLSQKNEYGRHCIPLQVFSDCNSLCETLEMVEPSATEKRLKLDLISLKENLDSKTIDTFTWLDTRIQVADGLTKHMDVTNMMRYFREGWYPYWHDDTNDKQYSNEKYTSAQQELRGLLALGQIANVYGD